MRPKVVALGGGHGLSASLAALRHMTDALTAIVTVADDGGSSGRLRDEYDVLQVLGRRSTGQQLVRLAGRRYDKHTHSDGTASWFDITALPEPRATAVTRG